MSKFEKFGSVTFSPTAVTDKEEVHGLHKRAEGSGCDCFSFCIGFDQQTGALRCNKTVDQFIEALTEGYIVCTLLSEGYVFYLSDVIMRGIYLYLTFYAFDGNSAKMSWNTLTNELAPAVD